MHDSIYGSIGGIHNVCLVYDKMEVDAMGILAHKIVQ